MSETLETCPEPSSGRVVFLHGSGTGPWIWDAARRHLPVASTALTVPSNRSGTDPVLCASEILSDPAFPAHGPVVLALHSLAGVLETPLAMALGDRLRHVVHVASVVPAPGRTFASTMGFPASLILPLLFRFQPQGLAPSPSMIVDQLGTDLDDAQRTELVARFRPEKGGLFLRPVPVEEILAPTCAANATAAFPPRCRHGSRHGCAHMSEASRADISPCSRDRPKSPASSPRSHRKRSRRRPPERPKSSRRPDNQEFDLSGEKRRQQISEVLVHRSQWFDPFSSSRDREP